MRHGRGPPSRSSSAAACSGGTDVHEDAGALLEAGDDRRCGGRRRRTSGTRRSPRPGGAVCTTTLYGGVAEQRVRARRARRAARSATTPSSASVASSNRARVERCATRISYGRRRRRTGTRPRRRGRRSTRATALRARGVGVGEDEVGARGLEAVRRVSITAGGTKSSATTCACGWAIDAPAARALVHEHLHVRVARPPRWTRARSRRTVNTSAASASVKLAEATGVVGGEDRPPRARRSPPRRRGCVAADDRVEVRDDADAPARRVGRAGAGAVHLGRGLVLVAGAERAVWRGAVGSAGGGATVSGRAGALGARR